LSAKLDALLDVDCQGAAQIRKWRDDVTSIFIAPPTYKDLEDRLRARKRDTEETIQRRLRNAREEFKRVDEFDYHIVNSDADEALEDFMVILQAVRGGNVPSLMRYCNPTQRQQWMRMVAYESRV
jgi:guanylate kinase